MSTDETFDPEELRTLHRFFIEEARAHLSAIGEALDALAADPGQAPLLATLRRRLHTLKGAAGSIGLSEASKRARDLEDRVAAVPLPAAPHHVAEVRAAVEQLARLIAAIEEGLDQRRA